MALYVLRPLRAIAHRLGRAYIDHLLNAESRAPELGRINERPIEYRFCFEAVNEYQPRLVLDVGTGQSALPSLLATCGPRVHALDNVRDYWPSGMHNRHYLVRDYDICDPAIGASIRERYNLITCISVIEHIVDHVRAVRGMMDLLAPGGRIVVTTPYNEVTFHENVYTISGSYGFGNTAYICRQSTRRELDSWLNCGLAIEREEYWRLFDSTYWSVGNLVRPPEVADKSKGQLGCFVFRRAE
jgi:2-polyprenyl-3-methyl-5-hydroxy-6-metoxy-1,4-benzoquinol methylase